MGQPWGIVLELHGWWHLGTAVAAYTFMALIEFLTAPEHLDGAYGQGFAWPAKNVLKDIVPGVISNRDKRNGVVNAAMRKEQ